MTDPVAILVVEDDVPTRTFLADNLTADGYALLTAGSVRDAVRALEYHRVDLAIVDVGLPDDSGLELLRRIREAGGGGSRLDARLPLIVLSGRAGDSDRVRALERGADDFVAKPFAYGELRLRVAAVLRRASERPGAGLARVGELVLDPLGRQVWLRGERVALAGKEFALLQALATEPTRVFTKAELLRDVWGFRAMGATRTLDTHACRLRQKLGVHGDRFVVNVWGVGYRLLDGAMADATTSEAEAAAAAGAGEHRP
ncbi:MAG TPA: response regulator transcription factor [Solirubrobacteraceae bacterium]|nr:response regulator transcription factor [Solirubrobacteraceae bacterium]